MLNDIRVGYSIASSSIKRSNKKTTILTIFVLSLVFVNLIFLPSMINGMMGIFVGAVTDYSYGNVIIEPSQNHIYIEDANSILEKINQLTGVSSVTKRLASGATLSYRDKYVGANVLGVVPQYEIEVSKFDDIVRDGEFLTQSSRNEIMLGSLLAGKEGGPEIYDDLGGVEVGTIINVTFSNGITRQYKVKGIHEAGPEISDLIAIISYDEMANVLKLDKNKANTILVRTYEGVSEEEVKKELIDLGIKEKIYTWQEKIQDMIRDMLKSFGTLNVLSEIVSLIIAAFILFIIIYINTLHRKKQIGILKAVGISKNSIIFSYMLMSVFYVTFGIIFGGLMLLAIVLYLNANPIVFYVTISLTPLVTAASIIKSTISLLLMSIVAGFIPAWMVTREPILKAIWGE